MMKKIGRLLVTFAMILAVFPVPVLAETELLTEDTVLCSKTLLRWKKKVIRR